MGEYQEAKKSEKTNKETHSDISKTQTKLSGQKANICPNCNAELPEEALFCPECGFSVVQHHCPKCGAPASPTADICQNCGVWLLEGQCKFCYAEIPDVALFCPECGKPKDGIPCPHCGNLSIFDFCTKCGKPVTEEAALELQRAQDEMLNSASSAPPKTFSSNQEARRWFNAHNPSTVAQAPGVEEELARLEALINSEPEPEIIEDEAPEPQPPVRKSLFSDRQLASIRKTGAAIDEANHRREEEARIAEEKQKEAARIAEERRKAAEARKIADEAERMRKEEERQRQIREAQARKEELERQRREAQARKEELERQLRARAWRCNAYGNTHPGGPNECGNPSMGGQWV